MAGPDARFAGDGPEKRYLDFLREGTLRIQRCGDCGGHVFYPRVVCTHCGSGNLDWVAPSGKASVYSVTVIHEKPEAGGNRNFAVIGLEEGPRLFSRVEGLAPEEVTIGMAVTARIATEESLDFPFLVFDPA
jgi:hypothetical protein